MAPGFLIYSDDWNFLVNHYGFPPLTPITVLMEIFLVLLPQLGEKFANDEAPDPATPSISKSWRQSLGQLSVSIFQICMIIFLAVCVRGGGFIAVICSMMVLIVLIAWFNPGNKSLVILPDNQPSESSGAAVHTTMATPKPPRRRLKAYTPGPGLELDPAEVEKFENGTLPIWCGLSRRKARYIHATFAAVLFIYLYVMSILIGSTGSYSNQTLYIILEIAITLLLLPLLAPLINFIFPQMTWLAWGNRTSVAEVMYATLLGILLLLVPNGV
jgi:hypothetical protein